MGMTLHAHIEVKKDGVWYHHSAPRVDRDYFLFWHIVAPKGDAGKSAEYTNPICKVCQLPDDISVVTHNAFQYDLTIEPVHHICVMTSEDIKALQNRLFYDKTSLRTVPLMLDLEWSIFKTYINHGAISEHYGWDDVRIVCWFQG